jgi:hypothetical protein
VYTRPDSYSFSAIRIERRVRPGPLLVLFLVVWLASACSGIMDGWGGASSDTTVGASSEGGDRTVDAGSGTTSGAEATVGVASEEETAGEAAGSSSVRFVEKPATSGGSRYGADSVLAVRYGAHEVYERVVVDLGVGDEPAGKVPEWNVMKPPDGGLLRVTFPSVSATAIPDGPLGDALLDRFYVVRAPEGGMFVDVFARRAFSYRVTQLKNPARLVVDFKPAGKPSGVTPPATGGRTVLLEPRSGARVGGPLAVSGYSRNFEASNTAILEDDRGKTLARQTIQANDWSSTWGYFETTLHAPAFRGKGTLRVGAQSPRDGTFQGVEVPVRGR